MVNDDWGFKTQTMLSTDSMRKYVFPWHTKIVEVIHHADKPAILHSCGNLNEVMTDVIEVMRFDGKHSFEDQIIPVEEAYERWGRQISVMGGLDMNFLATETPKKIRKRAGEMLLKSMDKGRYALGSGNSISDYIPVENYEAMVDVIKNV
jgi:uroporphyrinogen decarboxylase